MGDWEGLHASSLTTSVERVGCSKLPAPLMFCPKCKVEYRPGFTRCSDCEVDLVDVLPEEGLSSDDALTTLWECADETECVGVCQDLRSADIPYHVDEIPYEKTATMRVKWHYRILIFAQRFGSSDGTFGHRHGPKYYSIIGRCG